MNDAGPPHKGKENKKWIMKAKKKQERKMKWYLSIGIVTKMESDSISLAPSPPSVPPIKCTLSSRPGKYKVVYVVEKTGKQPQQGI